MTKEELFEDLKSIVKIDCDKSLLIEYENPETTPLLVLNLSQEVNLSANKLDGFEKKNQ